MRPFLLSILAVLIAVPVLAGEPSIRVKTSSGIKKVGLERYVLGVVSEEVYPDWPLETLKAQAVASRTYAIVRMREAQKAGRGWDVGSDTGHQVFSAKPVDPDSGVAQAVRETRGEGVCYEGEPIEAVFHSNSGGETEDASVLWGKSVPYLRRVKSPWSAEGPNYFWTEDFEEGAFLKKLSSLGVRGSRVIEIFAHGREGSDRVDSLGIETDAGSYDVSGKDLRTALGATVLRSLTFQVRLEGGQVRILGSGAGHGVGMCQWGARGLALEGVGYRQILSTYYPGTDSCELY